MKTLNSIGLADTEADVLMMSKDKKRVIDTFRDACILYGLPAVWQDTQVEAYLVHLESLFLAADTLNRHWKFVRETSEKVNRPVTVHEVTLFDFVKAKCRPVKDVKLPVSKELLIELCAAADIVFRGYDALLAKVVFLTAWGGFLRSSEYCARPRNGKTHALLAEGVTIMKTGIGLCFWSDKKDSEGHAVKHRVIHWSFLPAFAQELFEEFDKVRPPSKYYFAQNDGQPLTYHRFTNMLDACLLFTRWRGLRIVMHSFRLGTFNQFIHTIYACRMTNSG